MARNEKTKITKKEKVKKPRKKRRGLKVFLSILIILGAAGAVFWFGWVQFRIGEGQVGIVYTKSHGYEEKPLMNGEFEWRWQALLPTNLTLHLFDLETRSIRMDRTGSLPSGDLYSAMAGDGVSFDWNVEARYSYRIRPESLPSLVSDGMAAAGIESLYNEYESKVESELSRLLADTSFTDAGTPPEQVISALEKELENRGAVLDEHFDVIDAAILDWQIPDMELYGESRRLYLEYMGLRQAVMTEVEDNAVRREDIQGARLDLLSRYGEILTDYPVLLDLFSLEGNPGSSLLPPENLE